MANFEIITKNELLKSTTQAKNAHALLIGEKNDTHELLQGTISPKNKKIVPHIAITTLTLAIAFTGAYTALLSNTMQKAMTEPNSHINIMPLRDKNTIQGKLMANKIASLENQSMKRDAEGRYILEADITNTSEETYDVRIKVTTTLSGKYKDNSPYSYVVQNTQCDCASENTYFEETKVVVGNLQPHATKHIILYPTFANTSITDATVDAISESNIELDYATKTDKEIVNVEDIQFTYELSENGDTINIHAATEPAEMDTPSMYFEAVVIDKFGKPFGFNRADGITFPFGITTVKGTIEAHEKNSKGYGHISAKTDGSAARATLTSVHF